MAPDDGRMARFSARKTKNRRNPCILLRIAKPVPFPLKHSGARAAAFAAQTRRPAGADAARKPQSDPQLGYIGTKTLTL